MKRFALVLGLALLMGGCGPQQAPEPNPESRLRQELEAVKAENRQLAEELQQLGLEISGKPRATAEGACPGEVRTQIYNEKGKTCADLEGHVRGWSELCVADGACDHDARLTEAKASADAKCAAFCARHDCPSHHYIGPAECARPSVCAPQHPHCPESCPTKNICYLQQGDWTPNCWCEPPAL